MKFPLITAFACAAVLLCGRTAAQGTEQLLTTVGTTVPSAGIHHAYLLWQPGDAAATLGRRFAIYRKSGDADSAAAFSRLGIQTLQTSQNTIRAMLELGAKVDRAAAAAPARIDGLYREITLRGEAPPAAAPDPTLDAGGKLAFLIESAVTDTRTLSRLFFLGRAHPGVMMALGHAFSIPVSAGTHTFEIREIDDSDNDVQVAGRVTLDTAAPISLAPPASPVQVIHPLDPDSQHTVSPKDHLNVRLRWGVDATLRAQMPHSFGFDVFRVKRKAAESLGWDAAPPGPAILFNALTAMDPADPDPDISQANELPILVDDLLTPAQAADPADTERFDFSDDGVWHLGGDGKKIRRPFSDGESFYYFIAARGITGKPGQLSNGALVTLCDRLPPLPPTIASVLSSFVRPANPADWAAQGGSQFLQMKLRQLPSQSQSEGSSGYFVYRWSSPQEYLNSIGNPVVGRVGYIPHLNGADFRTFNDNGPGAPTLATHADKSVWYTVRAIGISNCAGQVLSGHSAPMPGFLRDFKAPDGPTGDFVICRQKPTAAFQDQLETKPEEFGLPADYVGIGVEAIRSSETIVAADIEVALRQSDQSWLVIHSSRSHYQNGNIIHIDLPYRTPRLESLPLRLRVRGITAHGLLSEHALRASYNPDQPPYLVHRFSLGVVEDCDPVSTVTGNPPVHEAFTLSGDVNPISGSISYTDPGVKEWRVYRRIGSDGPLSLVAKAEGDSIPNPGTWTDDALPVAADSSVCYFGQIFDQNGNPSPLTPLGCTTLTNPDIPTPMLSPATITGQKADRMQVKLDWFCDPAGVDRFEILVARKGGGDPRVLGLSPMISGGSTERVPADFPDLSFHTYQTSRVGGGIGGGPAFSVQIELPADKRAFFAVKACGPGTAVARARGSVSNVATARWQIQPTGPQAVIPWPARPLPGLFDHRQPIAGFTADEGPLWPIVLPTALGIPTGILVGLTRHPFEGNGLGLTQLFSPEQPENYLFKLREDSSTATSLEALMPFMLYRYQVDSVAFKNARANLVQCTPLIDRLSWKVEGDLKSGNAYHAVRDPFFQIVPLTYQIPLPVAGNWSDTASPVMGLPLSYNPLPAYLEDATGMILLKDPLPVTTGAKYRHLIVQFDTRGEIKRVIPLDPVQH